MASNYCAYPGCKEFAEFIAPANLCQMHWTEWWDYEFEVFDRQVIIRSVDEVDEDIETLYKDFPETREHRKRRNNG